MSAESLSQRHCPLTIVAGSVVSESCASSEHLVYLYFNPSTLEFLTDHVMS